MRKTVKPKQLVKFLEQAGFVCTRQSGSHVHMVHTDGRWTTIPRHNRELKKGTLHAILKDVGFSLDDL